MADPVTTTAQLADKWGDKAMNAAAQFADYLKELSAQYGSDAWHLAETMARIDAAGVLLKAWIGIAFLIAAYTFQYKFSKWAAKTCDDNDIWIGIIIGGAVYATIVGFIGFGAFGAMHVADIWPYAGVYEPKLWIAHQMLQKL